MTDRATGIGRREMLKNAGGHREMTAKGLNLFPGNSVSFQPGIAITYALIALVAIVAAAILVLTNGNLAAALVFIAALTVVFATLYRVEWGFYLFFGMVLTFDQFLNPMPFGTPITAKFGYFMNLKQNPFLPPFAAGDMNPIEIQLALILLAWFIAISVRRYRKIQGIPFWGFALLLFLEIFAVEFHGLHGGGSFLKSLWEIRALIYFLLLYFLVPQIIQTREQVNVVVWIFVIIISIKALQGALRFAEMGFKFDGYTVLTNHEDPMFMADLFILGIGLSQFGAKVKLRRAILWLLPILLLGFYSGQRRAAYAGFFVGLGIFIVMLTGRERLKFLRSILPILLVVTAYTIIFWNYHGRLAAPIQLVKSGFFKSAQEAGARYDSNLYRAFERYDLAATVKSAPIIGIGWGKEYLTPIPLVNIGFSLQHWIPHDEILWLMVEMGAVGFFIFFLFIDSILFEAGRLGRKVKDPFLRSLAFMIAAMVVNQMVISYFDLQLTFYRDMIFMGTFCGLLPTIRALDKNQSAPPKPARASTPSKKVVAGEEVTA